MSSDERVRSGRISAALRRDAANQVADPAVVTAAPAVRMGNSRGIWIGVSLTAVVIVALSIWLSLRHASPTPIPAAKPVGPYLNLDLRVAGDQLQLVSNSNLTDVKRAQLDVFDGNSLQQADVTGPFKGQQAISVPHTTGNVQVVLTVDSASGSLTRKAGFTDAAAILKSDQPAKQEPIKQAPTRHKRHRRGR